MGDDCVGLFRSCWLRQVEEIDQRFPLCFLCVQVLVPPRLPFCLEAGKDFFKLANELFLTNRLAWLKVGN